MDEEYLNILHGELQIVGKIHLKDAYVEIDAFKLTSCFNEYRDGIKWHELSANAQSEYIKAYMPMYLRWLFSKFVTRLDTDALCIITHKDNDVFVKTDFTIINTKDFNALKDKIQELENQVEDLEAHISDLSSR